LESHLNAHESVVEAGVGATWDEGNLTELPTAYVVLKAQFRSLEEKLAALKAIHQQVDGQVSGYKKLRGGVWNIESLPINATGKIDRKKLRDNLSGQCSLMDRESVAFRARL
jgi:acyl-coenzyme A synthetase/AMP-(fatty) acid ligase